MRSRGRSYVVTGITVLLKTRAVIRVHANVLILVKCELVVHPHNPISEHDENWTCFVVLCAASSGRQNRSAYVSESVIELYNPHVC